MKAQAAPPEITIRPNFRVRLPQSCAAAPGGFLLTHPLTRSLLLSLLCCLGSLSAAVAAPAASDFIATLSPGESQEFTRWQAAQTHFERCLDAYWHEVEHKRVARKQKRAPGHFYAPADYVLSFPPEYSGPLPSPDLAQRWARYLAAKEQAQPSTAKMRQPGVDDFLAAAKAYYGFEPARISE